MCNAVSTQCLNNSNNVVLLIARPIVFMDQRYYSQRLLRPSLITLYFTRIDYVLGVPKTWLAPLPMSYDIIMSCII